MRRKRSGPVEPSSPEHRCDDCRKTGGFVETTDGKGRHCVKPCPRAVIQVQAPAPSIDAASRAAGEKEGE